MDREYKVKLEVFEGPLDLLLYLIKKDEVDIYDVSIERITKQYLAYLETFEMLNIELAGEFIVMAANLLYIKSRMLLPVDQQMAEEDAEEDDPRWELIRQLIEYKKFKEVANRLREREAMQEALFPRMPVVPELEPEGKLFAEEVGIFDLINAFQKILKRHEEKPEDLKQIFEENFTVGDKIEHLLKLTSSGVPMRFEELFSDAATRGEIVVTFLAMLELIRMKHLRVRQTDQFGEIWIEPLGAEAKPYFSRESTAEGEPETEKPPVEAGSEVSEDRRGEAEKFAEFSRSEPEILRVEETGAIVETAEWPESPDGVLSEPVVAGMPLPEVILEAVEEPLAESGSVTEEEITEANEALGFGEVFQTVPLPPAEGALDEPSLSEGMASISGEEPAEPLEKADGEPDSRPLGA